jgi:hypothetical protein
MNKRVGGFGPPTTWEFTIRRPVAFDARPSLRAFLREGERPQVDSRRALLERARGRSDRGQRTQNNLNVAFCDRV